MQTSLIGVTALIDKALGQSAGPDEPRR